ncbi:hypothetical protein PUMCH_004265 [Australozyma saopauloensis]|uniref:Putative lipoate-protein ligase A n=1 Tax=Australozyma saopauloensis TaxID=291208 RepID=A0AAX4HE36_9ASCO|nr:hypothetical protein PUMCH_004265 [[Candida] saopauloensis]
MIQLSLRAGQLLRGQYFGGGFSLLSTSRSTHNVPFQDDLTPLDDDLFNLQDFQEYKEAPDVLALRKKYGAEEQMIPKKQKTHIPQNSEELPEHNASSDQQRLLPKTFQEHCEAKEPVVFISRLLNPYLNLALEDYIYHAMGIPAKGSQNWNRLLFYVNSPCVVIGKNQNPWKEVNLPLLTNLRLPLVRRRSGGGTVVHDNGNVNYSFMTTRDNFDRFTFANLVKNAVNSLAKPSKHVMVNDRGDIVTKSDNKKVSGSAYKISRGKSYHHGTMLLNLKLDVLRELLHRDESKLGSVHSLAAISSVKSLVTNLELELTNFIDAVTAMFQDLYGILKDQDDAAVESEEDLNQTELLGLSDFVSAFTPKSSLVFEIDEDVKLPDDIHKTKDELMQWEWRFGSTPKFLHHFVHPSREVKVEIEVGAKAAITKVEVEGPSKAVESFQFLKEAVEKGRTVLYTGSNVAGYVLDDELSEWIGEAIDGTS